MNILGISAFYHDSAATLLQEGEIIAAAQEERFSRIRHDKSFPSSSVKFCLESSGLSLNEIDAVAFYEKPFLKFERLLETYYFTSPAGISSFIASMPSWLSDKLNLKGKIKKELKKISGTDCSDLKFLFPEHHLSHAASAFYPSPFENAAILTVDGTGEWTTASISIGNGNKIKVIKEMKFPDSVGLLYSAFTYFLGFVVNSGEYKLMGLSPYGSRDSDEVKLFVKKISENIVTLFDDGSIRLNVDYFDFLSGLKMINETKWEKLFGFKKKGADEELLQCHCNLALAIQEITSGIMFRMAAEAKRLTGCDKLCLAGGVALNCVSNSVLYRSGLFSDIWIQPAAGDAGGSTGAAFASYHIYYEKARNIISTMDKMNGALSGPSFTDANIYATLKKFDPVYRKIGDFGKLCEETASLLANGNVIGWFRGRMEFGPRALGNRSILADARDPEMQRKVNMKIKFREGFRPFAPSVNSDDAALYFEPPLNSPYMLFVANVRESLLKELPLNYSELSPGAKLHVNRSELPAITHIDNSSRLQTVDKNINPDFHQLISTFKQMTGCGVLLNTSFNVRGEPIVCSPEDAYLCFMASGLDYLVIGSYLLSKKEQPGLDKRYFVSRNFKAD